MQAGMQVNLVKEGALVEAPKILALHVFQLSAYHFSAISHVWVPLPRTMGSGFLLVLSGLPEMLWFIASPESTWRKDPRICVSPIKYSFCLGSALDTI